MPRPNQAALRGRLIAALAAAWLAVPLFADDTPRYTPDRPFDMKHIKLELAPDLEKKHVAATATLSLAPLRPAASVTLDAVDFQTHEVRGALGEGPATEWKYRNDGKQIEVFFPETVAPGTQITLTIRYSLSEPKDGLHFFQPSEDDPDAPYQLWSQGQALENRYWVPSFDHPGERQTTEVIATVDDRFQVLSNGKLLGKQPAGAGKTTWHWSQATDHVVYLVTLVVGDFFVKEETWQGIPVRYYVPRDRAADVDRSFSKTPRMLDVFSEKIGVKYAWDQYAQVCCYRFGGGMENTSATTLGDRTLHDERAHLDRSSDDLVAHELAHQWWGDLLTCREWAHLWLNEGFASWFEAYWTEFDLGPDEGALDIYQKAQGAMGGGKSRPIVDRYYDSAGQMFDSRAYPKGAWVLNMLRRRVGDETYWKILNHYCVTNQHRTVETADFRRAIEDVTGTSWERFFFDWTERAGHPIVDAEVKWNEADKQATIELKQRSAAIPDKPDDKYKQVDPRAPWKAYDEEPFHFPLRVEFYVEGQAEPVVVTREITADKDTITAVLPAAPRMVRIDPEQAVLMELREVKGRDLWLNQLRDDPGAVGRIRAAEQLGKEGGDANRQALCAALAAEKFWGVQRTIAQQLGKLKGDASRDALLAGLTSPESRVRTACVEALDGFGRDAKIAAAVRTLIEADDPSYEVQRAAADLIADQGLPDVLAVLRPMLDRKSEDEILRRAALRALARQPDPQVFELLLAWTAADKPRECREVALESLGAYTRDYVPDAAQVERVLTACTALLEGQPAGIRRAAAGALGALGSRGTAALPILRRIAQQDKRDDVKGAAQRAVEQIEKGAPGDQQLRTLRQELEDLKKRHDDLQRKFDESKAAPHEARADAPSPS